MSEREQAMDAARRMVRTAHEVAAAVLAEAAACVEGRVPGEDVQQWQARRAALAEQRMAAVERHVQNVQAVAGAGL